MPGGSANAYDFANADPVNQVDLSGRKAKIGLGKSRAVSASPGGGAAAAGSSAPASVSSAPAHKTRTPFKTKPFKKIGCTIGPAKGLASTAPNGWTTVTLDFSFNCDSPTILVGFIVAQLYGSPNSSTGNPAYKGDLFLSLSYWYWEPAKYCIVGGNEEGESFNHACGPIVLVPVN
jgi:hypothetical protein